MGQKHVIAPIGETRSHNNVIRCKFSDVETLYDNDAKFTMQNFQRNCFYIGTRESTMIASISINP